MAEQQAAELEERLAKLEKAAAEAAEDAATALQVALRNATADQLAAQVSQPVLF